MAEPISTTSATAAATGVALLSLFPGVDANVVMGAFAGALLFVMTAADFGITKRFVFFVISFIAGCTTAHMCATALDYALPAHIEVHAGIGALVSAALVVKLLMWVIARADHPDRLFNLFKGGNKE